MSAITAAGRAGGKHGGVDVFMAMGFIPGDATNNVLFISIAVADGINGSTGNDTLSCNFSVGPLRVDLAIAWSHVISGSDWDQMPTTGSRAVRAPSSISFATRCSPVRSVRADLLVGGSGAAGFHYKTMNETPNSFGLRDRFLDSARHEPNQATDVPVVAANPLLGGMQAFVWKGPIGSPLALAFGKLGYTRVVGAHLRSGAARPLWISACGSTATAL